MFDKIEQNKGKDFKDLQYIGLSKLCCPDCSAAIKAFNKVMAEKYPNSPQMLEIEDSENEQIKSEESKIFEFAARGAHDISSDWVTPPFLTGKYLEYYKDYKKEFERRIQEKGKEITSMYPKDSSSGSDPDKPTVAKKSVEKDTTSNITKQQCLDQLYTLAIKGEVTLEKILEIWTKANEDKGTQVGLNNSTLQNTSIVKNSIKTLQDKSAMLGYGTQNAFNQYRNFEYCYESEVINKIVENIKTEYGPNIFFPEVLGNLKDAQNPSHMLKDYSKNPLKPLMNIYNVSASHWATYAIIPLANNQLKMFYKDSLGWDVEQDFKNKITEVFGEKLQIERIEPGKKDQDDMGHAAINIQVSCGIFALENMQIMARSILKSPNDIEESLLRAQYFAPDNNTYRQEISSKREEYALIYAKGLKLSIENGQDIPISQRRAEIIVQITANNAQKIKDFSEIIIGKVEVTVCLSNDEEKPKLGAYYYKVTGREVIQILKAHQAEEDRDYVVAGDEVKISNKIIELKDANVADLPEAKSIKAAFENALNKDQAIYDSKFAAEIKEKLGIVLPTRELIIEKFEEAIVNKENKDEDLINFQNQLQKLQDDYHVRDMV